MVAFNVNELNNLYSQLNQLSGNSLGGTGLGQTMQSYNEIAWFGEAISNLNSEEVSSKQKADIVQNMVEKALPMIEKFISKLTSNESNTAKKEVDNEKKRAEELVERSKNTEVRLQGEFSQIADDIDVQTEIVEDANEILEKTKEAVEEKQKEIEEFIKKIEEQQAIVSDPEKSNEEKLSALNEIQGLTTQIAEIVASIEVDNATIQQLTEAVENASNNIETSTAQMEVVEQDGEAEIQKISADAGDLVNDVSKTGETGTLNNETGEAAESAAQAASSNSVTGATVAPKLFKLADDQKEAGNTRLSSIQGNINEIAQGIGNLSNSKNIIKEFKNSIGKSLGDFGKAIGSWDTMIDPVLKGVGTITSTAAVLTELDTAVEADIATINESSEGMEFDNKSEQKPEEKDQENNNKKEADELNFETPKVKLRTFGI